MGSTLKGRVSGRTMVAMVLCLGILNGLAQRAGADIPPARGDLSLSPDSGGAGTLVVARGSLSGFKGPNDSIWSEPVSIYFGSELVARTSTDEIGRFAAWFRVPRSPVLVPHDVTVRAVGDSTQREVWAVFVAY
jgi:hypothetical protein